MVGVAVTGDITINTTWINTNTYTLDNDIYIRKDANFDRNATEDGGPNGNHRLFTYSTEKIVLTIEPGTKVYGINGASLIVTREGQLDISGTKENPVIFRANENATYDPPATNINLFNHNAAPSDSFGGIFILGSAATNVVDNSLSTTYFNPQTDYTKYGGGNSNDYSGTINYLSIRYSKHGLVLAGVGRGTTIDNVEIVKSQNNGLTLLGGSVSTKRILSAFSHQNGFVWDEGHSGTHQFWCYAMGSSIGEAGILGKSGVDGGVPKTPISCPQIYNVTGLGNDDGITGDEDGSVKLQDKTLGGIYNSIFVNIHEQATNMGPIKLTNMDDLGTTDSNFILTNNVWFADPTANSPGSTTYFGSSLLSTRTDMKNFVENPIIGGANKNALRTDTNKDALNCLPIIPEITSSTLGSKTIKDRKGNFGTFLSGVNYKGAFDPAANAWVKDWTLVEEHSKFRLNN